MDRTLAPGQDDAPPVLTDPLPIPSAPSGAHRALALVAAISLLIATRSAWTSAVTAEPIVMVGLSVSYLAIIGAAILTLTVRTRQALTIVEALILAIGVGMVVGSVVLHHQPSDEGALIVQAARSWLAGGAIYGVPWPGMFVAEHVPITWMMNGGADYTLGYPPLAVILTAPVVAIHDALAASSVVTTLALLGGAVALWALLPTDRRSAATMLMLGFPFLPHYARLGYPAIIAMVLLIPVVARWPMIGASGRLSRADLVRAAFLGAACAAQQLAWFVVPFLLVGLFAVRHGSRPARASAKVVAAFAGVAALTWLVIDLPFIVRDPAAWASGIALVLTQHAIPHGQGLIDVSFYLTDGTAALGLYTAAGLALTLALLLISAIWMRRLGPALTVLPWIAFYLSVRSQDGYFLLMTPIWLAAMATATPDAFDRAWQLRPNPRAWPWRARPRFTAPTGRARRLTGLAPVLAVVAIFTPTLVLAAGAITSDEPIELDVLGTVTRTTGQHGLVQIDVRAQNDADVPLTPHFTVSVGEGITPFWTASGGPPTLGPHQSATYHLVSPQVTGYIPGPKAFMFLRALTDAPETVSTTHLDPRGGTG